MDRLPGAERRLTPGPGVTGVQETLPGLDDLLPEPVAVVVEPDGGLLALLPGAGGWAGGYDLLWSVVGTNHLRDRADVDTALARVRRRLAGLGAGEVGSFARQVREVLRLLDVDDLRDVPVRARGAVPAPADHHFEHACCACVLAGREAVAAALAEPRTFARFVRPELSGGLLLNVADEAHAARTGRRLP